METQNWDVLLVYNQYILFTFLLPANLYIDEIKEQILSSYGNGVYIGFSKIEGKNYIMDSVISIGKSPFFNDQEKRSLFLFF